MGCCQSVDRAPHDEAHQAPHPAPRARAQDVVVANNASSLHEQSAAAAAAGRSPSAARAAPPTGRPNKPIRPPSPLPSSPSHIAQLPPPWTRAQLEQERDAFFDTRVSGNREVWNGLRVVADMLRRVPPQPTLPSPLADEDHVDDDSPDANNGLSGAQAVLDALNITCPHGRIAQGRGRDRVKGGLYDDRGILYELPAWVLRDPQDLIEDVPTSGHEGGGEKEMTGSDDDDDGEDDDDDKALATARRREEKGKGRAADVGEAVSLRARLSDRGSDLLVDVGTKQKLAVVVRSIQEQIGSPRRRIRLMYLGKTLDENKTLEESGWRTGHVINAMVYEAEETKVSSPGKKRRS